MQSAKLLPTAHTPTQVPPQQLGSLHTAGMPSTTHARSPWQMCTPEAESCSTRVRVATASCTTPMSHHTLPSLRAAHACSHEAPKSASAHTLLGVEGGGGEVGGEGNVGGTGGASVWRQAQMRLYAILDDAASHDPSLVAEPIAQMPTHPPPQQLGSVHTAGETS